MKWVHSDVLLNGINHLVNNTTKLVLISTYTANDDYATVLSNTTASVDMTSADFTVTGSAGTSFSATTAAGKQDPQADSAVGGVNNHLALLDGNNGKVLYVTPETSGVSPNLGAPLNFPQVTYISSQPN